MKTFLLLTLAATGFGVTAGAQMITLINPTTNNGSFETSPATKTFFTPTTSNASAIPFWGSTTGTNDTGVDPADVNIVQNGAKGAFEQPGTGIFNLVTSRPIVAGDVYTLTFYARDSNGGASTSPLTASLYAQTATATGTTYSYTPLGAPLATITPTLTNAAFGPNSVAYTLTYTAVAADAGNDIGIAITNSGVDYNGLDNFVLTVSPVPEPRTYAMLAAGGLGTALMVFRRRRA